MANYVTQRPDGVAVNQTFREICVMNVLLNITSISPILFFSIDFIVFCRQPRKSFQRYVNVMSSSFSCPIISPVGFHCSIPISGSNEYLEQACISVQVELVHKSYILL